MRNRPTPASNTRSIGVLEGMTTGIQKVSSMMDEQSQGIRVYDLRGILIKSGATMEEVKRGLKAGIYVVNGKKMIIE